MMGDLYERRVEGLGSLGNLGSMVGGSAEPETPGVPAPIVDYSWTSFTGVDWTANDVQVDPDVSTIENSAGVLGQNDRMIELGTTALHYLSASTTLTLGTVYTVSLVVKPVGTLRNVIYLNTYDASQAYIAVNLATQAVIDSLHASGISVTAVGNGYYRLQFSFTSAGGAHGLDIFEALDDGTLSYAGTNLPSYGIILESLTITHPAA